MPIPVLQPQMPTFQSANPGLMGAQALTQTLGGVMHNMGQAAQLPYIAPAAKAALQRQQLANQLSQATMPYAVPTMKAKIGLEQSQAKLAPLMALLKGGQLQQSMTRFGPAYQLSKVLLTEDPGSRADFRANYPNEWHSVLQQLGQAAIQNQNNPYGNEITKQLSNYFPDMKDMISKGEPVPPEANAVMQQIESGQQQSEPQGISIQGKMSVPQPQQLQDVLNQLSQKQSLQQQQQTQQTQQQTPEWQQHPFAPTPAKIQDAATLAKWRVNWENTESSVRTRAQSATAMDQYLVNNRKYAPRIINALNYVGLKGKSKIVQQLFSKENPQSYQDYMWFVNDFTKGLTTQIGKTEGLGGTDQQTKIADQMSNLTGKSTLSPKSAMNIFNEAMDTMQTITSSIQTAAEPRYKGTYKKYYGIPDFKGDYLGLKQHKTLGQTLGTAAQPTQLSTAGFSDMRSPDGITYEVPAKNVQKAVKGGWKLL